MRSSARNVSETMDGTHRRKRSRNSNRTTVSPPPWFDPARRFKALKPSCFSTNRREAGRTRRRDSMSEIRRTAVSTPGNSSGASGDARLEWGVAAMERWNEGSAVLGAQQRWVWLLRARRTSTRINSTRLSHPERHHTSRNPVPHLASARCLTRKPFAVATNG